MKTYKEFLEGCGCDHKKKKKVDEAFKQMPGERMASQRDRLEGKARDLEKGRETKKKSERAAKYRMQSNSIRNAGLQDFNAKGEKYNKHFDSKYRREETEIEEGAAWTKKSGKNSEGGLNEKGRKSYERENPGSDLKAPSKEKGNPRRRSFCARMKGCLLYTSPSPRDATLSRMPSSA